VVGVERTSVRERDLTARLEALEARLKTQSDDELTDEQLEREAAALRRLPRMFRAPLPRR
jgi:hypothetical protein